MESNGEQFTQATQRVVDPRRLGKQNSGFSDEEISDIICLLVPLSPTACQQLEIIGERKSKHLVGRDDANRLDLDYTGEDMAGAFRQLSQNVSMDHIALRFSAQVKDPRRGFVFGRNPRRCDVCFEHDPGKHLSNMHFRIYLNEYGVLMLEDLSTNGTFVDQTLLKAKSSPGMDTMRTLCSGSQISILMHTLESDLVFLVRIPLRDGVYQAAYHQKLRRYIAGRKALDYDVNETIVPGPGGHIDLFRPLPRRQLPCADGDVDSGDAVTQNMVHVLPSAWHASNSYNLVGQIGKGAFATVYKVTSKFDGLPWAAKELDKRKFMKNGILDQKVENEMRIMQRIKHPNIVQYMETIDWRDKLIIIMEFVAEGDLGKVIGKKGSLSETGTKIMAAQLLDALGYLHSSNITHRDVKPDNILVSSLDPFVVKLTDFGLSKMIDNEQTFLRTFCGTLLYCAPEVYSEFADYDQYGRRDGRNRQRQSVARRRYDHAVDIWSLGGVLFYALTKKPPYPVRSGAGYSELLHSIMTQPLDTEPLERVDVSPECIDFLYQMLDRRPESRATVEELQNHPWIVGTQPPHPKPASRSLDDVSDDLQLGTSQLSLRDREAESVSHSDDEILDEEAVDGNDQNGCESEKENYTFGRRKTQQQRLFGEVNTPALQASGPRATDRLDLSRSANRLGTTEMMGGGSEIRDSFSFESDSTPRQRNMQTSQPQSGPGPRGGPLSLNESSPSTDAIEARLFDPASQSLAGAESILGNLNMKSSAGTRPCRGTGEPRSFKRKSSVGTSNGSSKNGPLSDGPTVKRLRSESFTDQTDSEPDQDSDTELCAVVPSLTRGHSCRQFDEPVHKSVFWMASDKTTWHLKYPEMTQRQLDAFKVAATARGEEFERGKTALWDVAMKYFPAKECREAVGQQQSPAVEASADIPDTQPQDLNVHVPAQSDRPGRTVVAWLRSTPESAVANISVSITEAIATWGRAIDNTRSFFPKSEIKVPKYAFKIVLWKDDYDPYRNYRPWNCLFGVDEDAFHFYISTKATYGIFINGVHLSSQKLGNTAHPCNRWIRLQDGDTVVVWKLSDVIQTKLIFNCAWGGSSKTRMPEGPGLAQPALESDAVARKLDEAYGRAEKKARNMYELDLRMEEADHDIAERKRNVEKERERSKVFERRRAEAVCELARRKRSRAPVLFSSEPYMRQNLPPATRGMPALRSSSKAVVEPSRMVILH